MKTGTGIFLASIIISFVVLYISTRKELDWSCLPAFITKHKKNIINTFALVLTFLILILVSKYILSHIEERNNLKSKIAIEKEEMQKSQQEAERIIELEKEERKKKEQELVELKEAEKKRFEFLNSPGESIPYKMEFRGFSLGKKKGDIIFENGQLWPSNLNLYDFLNGKFSSVMYYDVHNFLSTSGHKALIHIRFNNDVIDCLLFDPKMYGYKKISEECGRNRKIPNSLTNIIEKFGQPTVIVNNNDISRTYYYDEYGLAVVLSSGMVDYMAVYNPESRAKTSNTGSDR